MLSAVLTHKVLAAVAETLSSQNPRLTGPAEDPLGRSRRPRRITVITVRNVLTLPTSMRPKNLSTSWLKPVARISPWKGAAGSDQDRAGVWDGLQPR